MSSDKPTATYEELRTRQNPEQIDEMLSISASALEQRLLSAAIDCGFRRSHETKSYFELMPVDRDNGTRVVYIDRSKTLRNKIAVFVHPDFELDSLRSIPDLTVPAHQAWVHSSNMRAFPKRSHTGKEPITYGYSIRCETEQAYGRLLEQVRVGRV